MWKPFASDVSRTNDTRLRLEKDIGLGLKISLSRDLSRVWVSLLDTTLEGHYTHTHIHTKQSRLLVGFVRKGRHDDRIVGDGWALCKPFGDWSKHRFEVTTHTLIGCPHSHEGSHAKDFRKGLLFLCFREPKVFAIYPVPQSNNETEKWYVRFG